MRKIDLMSMKPSISIGLINEYEKFITSTLDFFEANKDSYVRLAFEEISDKQPPFFLNYEFAKKFIQEAISGKSKVELRSKIGDGYPWYNNEINSHSTQKFLSHLHSVVLIFLSMENGVMSSNIFVKKSFGRFQSFRRIISNLKVLIYLTILFLRKISYRSIKRLIPFSCQRKNGRIMFLL